LISFQSTQLPTHCVRLTKQCSCELV